VGRQDRVLKIRQLSGIRLSGKNVETGSSDPTFSKRLDKILLVHELAS
jgi:hypothetical protein